MTTETRHIHMARGYLHIRNNSEHLRRDLEEKAQRGKQQDACCRTLPWFYSSRVGDSHPQTQEYRISPVLWHTQAGLRESLPTSTRTPTPPAHSSNCKKGKSQTQEVATPTRFRQALMEAARNAGEMHLENQAVPAYPAGKSPPPTQI